MDDDDDVDDDELIGPVSGNFLSLGSELAGDDGLSPTNMVGSEAATVAADDESSAVLAPVGSSGRPLVLLASVVGPSAGEMLPLMRLLPEASESPPLVVEAVAAVGSALAGGLLLVAPGFMNGILGLLVLEAPNRLGL